jgi:hypothetical protein
VTSTRAIHVIKGVQLLSNTGDVYLWQNQYGGLWNVPANWFDNTTGTIAAAAPATSNVVTITGGTNNNFTNIAGAGTAAQLAINNDVLLWGSITVAAGTTLAASADLDLDGSATLAAASLSVGTGALLVVGGASTVTVTGGAAVQAGFISVLDGSKVQFASLIADNTDIGFVPATNTIAVDGASSLEVGSGGGAALGAITIDAGQSAVISGSLFGSVVNNGTLAVQAGGVLNIDVGGDPYDTAYVSPSPNVIGSGTLLLSEHSVLTLEVADSAALRFGGPGGTLDLIGLLPSGTISGFAAGDLIELNEGDTTVLATGLNYTQTTNSTATLTLTKAGTTVGRLTLAGNYTGDLFHLGFDTQGDGFITLQTLGIAPVQPSLIAGTAGTDTLVATANNQTLTGLGGNDTLSAANFTGVAFTDTTANLNGSTFTSFAASDVIDLTDLNPNTASVSYIPGTPTATLIITDGNHTATVTLSLAAALPPGLFSISTDGAAGTDIRYTAFNTDAYVFAATPGGLYTTAASWQDTTTATIAAQAPSYGNAVTIGGASGYTNVTGNGFAASLATSGNVLLRGNLLVGTKIVGVPGTLTQTGTLTLDGNADLSLVGTASVGGLIQVGGASTLTVAGGLMFSTNSASVLAIGASTVQFATLLPTTTSYAGSLYDASAIGVDTASRIEFGSAGNVAVGALTIDRGLTVNLGGTINGNVVVNGTLIAAGTLAVAPFGLAAPAVSGTGMLELTYGTTLGLAGPDTAAILFSQTSSGSFATTTETLALGTIMPTGTITGFAKGDTITVGFIVTNLTWNGARLTLLNGATPVGYLLLSGTAYAANQFQVQLSPNGLSSIITYTATPATVGGNSVSGNSDTYNWTNTGGGVWTVAASWTDTSAGGGIASAAPGATNPVTINDNPGFWGSQIIYGPAQAASLTVDANTIFNGVFTIAGQFTVNDGGASGDVALASAANLNAGSLFVTTLLRLSGASLLTVLGTGTGTFISGELAVGSGSAVRISGGTTTITGTIAVDGTSSAEFGTAGTATSGTLAVDAGLTLTLQGTATIAANAVINGSLLVYAASIGGFGGGAGTITGSGTIYLGALGSSGYLVLNATETNPIVFEGYNNGAGSYAFESFELKGPIRTGTITGFLAGDTIIIDRNVTGATFTQTTGSQGVLTLTNGAVTVGTLTLNGNYAASLFQVDVAPVTGIATISVEAAPVTAGTALASTGTHAYNWTGASGGNWTTAANWLDLSTGLAPTTVPGSGDPVTIVGNITPGQYTTVGGNGATATLGITGNVLLTGQISIAGSLNVSSGNGPAAALALEAGASVTAAGSVLVFGKMEVGGGSAVTLPGYAVLFGGSLLALDGSTVQVGGLIGDSGGDVIAVDTSSVLKIGASVNAPAGALTVSASAPAAFAGVIYGSVVLNGALWVAGGGSLFIDLSGTAEYDPYASNPTISGTNLLVLTDGSTLGLGVVDTAPIEFNGPNATLVLAAMPTNIISGFVAGDQIQLDQSVTGMSYQQVNGSLATLTLTSGASTVGTLRLAGSFGGSNSAFHLDASANGTTAVITLQSLLTTPPQMSLIYGTVGADVLTATGNGQTITGQGGGDILSGASFTGIDFKDYSFYLSGSEILNFATADIIDFIDITPGSAIATYTGGTLAVTDGTHAASLTVAFGTTPASGSFHIASDGASGSKLTWS